MDNDYSAVTEVGTFGDLNIKDPTEKDIKKKDKSVEELITESVQENKENLTNR